MNEVVAVQGTPDSFSEGTFNYGSSRVYFRNSRVSSWKNNYSSLKAKLVPAPHTFNRGYFTVGSTKDEVIAVQGTPDSFSEGTFNYGSSRVYFRNSRVSSWKNNYSSLKAKLVPAPHTSNRGYFTVGSTKDEVIAVQGTPDSFSEGTFNYGSSRVYFRNGRVSSWKNNYSSLKAKLVPAPQTPNRGYFTVGSTKDEVIAVQGTPDSFSEGTFNYGSSRVYFRNSRVSSWKNNYSSLKAKLVPAPQTPNRGYFTVGSTKDEVIAVQGTPDSFSEGTFNYGSSRVYFRNSRVSSWKNNYSSLKAKLVPAPQTPNRGYFTVGSTKDEVIAVQGTPDSFSEYRFNYGYSHVSFGNGRVTSWDNSIVNPLKAKLIPAKYTPNKGYFTVGSTKDEVIAVQGTPDSFSEYRFNYGYSHVSFGNGRVTSWDNSIVNPLKAKLIPAKYTPNKGYFTVGSTKDEVITVQGTPDSFSEYRFNYGYSHVSFSNGRVTSWDNSVVNPLKVR